MATTNIKNNFNVEDHDGGTQGLMLGGVLLEKTAAELNALTSGGGSTADNVYNVGPNAEYTTISAALTAIGDAADLDDNTTPQTIRVAGGVYDEDLTIPKGRIIALVAEGTVILGDGLGSNWSSTNSRSITTQFENAFAFGANAPRPALVMGVSVPSDATSTFVAQAAGWRISGDLNLGGDAQTHSIVMEAVEINGIVNKTTIGFTNVIAKGCLFKGAVNAANATHLTRLDNCQFNALVTVDGYNQIRYSEIRAGMTVTAVVDTLPPSGMFATEFTGTFTGPAGSLKLDSATDHHFIANAATLAGGATKVYLDSLPATEIVFDDSTASLGATTVQGAIEALDSTIDGLPGGHDAVTLNADDATQETLNLSGQELQVNLATTTTDGAMSAVDKTKLAGIEALADVTDEANVTGALDGANLTAVTVEGTDKVMIQDVSDLDNLKTVTAQSIADLAAGGGSGSGWETVTTTDLSSPANPASIEETGLDGSTYEYRFLCYGLCNAAGGNQTFLRCSVDNGTSYDSTASYTHNVACLVSAGTFDNRVGAQTGVHIHGTANGGATSSTGYYGEIKVNLTSDPVNDYNVIRMEGVTYASTRSVLGPVRYGNASSVDALEITAESGNLGAQGTVIFQRRAL